MEIHDIEHADFRDQGFMVVPGLLCRDEVATLRGQADAIVARVDDYRQRCGGERARLQALHRREGIEAAPRSTAFAEEPEVRIDDRYARRGDRVYPTRQLPVDESAQAAAAESGDPWDRLGSTIDHLADHDDVFRRFASHPRIVETLTELLAPDLRLWFDHLYNKPPYNDAGSYRGANRFHQDGFFHLDRRSVTCWIALDEVTRDNGCFHYVPIGAGYGQVRFDEGVAAELTAPRLQQAVRVTLNPGDVVFHDRWTMHATGPNETAGYRRGWALHYCDAASRYGDFADDPGWKHDHYRSPDGIHLRDGIVHGNRDWLLVAGRSYEGDGFV
jgi:hypothetical protein